MKSAASKRDPGLSREAITAAQDQDVELIFFALRLLANNGPHSERHAVKAAAALDALLAKNERLRKRVTELKEAESRV